MTDAIATVAAQTSGSRLPEPESLRPRVDHESGIDLSLILENLRLTPWERLLANDDTINFCDMARAAMQRRNATS